MWCNITLQPGISITFNMCWFIFAKKGETNSCVFTVANYNCVAKLDVFIYIIAPKFHQTQNYKKYVRPQINIRVFCLFLWYLSKSNGYKRKENIFLDSKRRKIFKVKHVIIVGFPGIFRRNWLNLRVLLLL